MTDTITMIPVAACRPSPSARPVLIGKVIELVASIREVGLRQPINVRPLPGGEYEIRGGGHRVAAFAELGRETIPAFVREDDDLRAELAEIDENLIRNELGPADRAAAIARRKAIYEALHPETVHGQNQHTRSRQVGDSSPPAPRFTKSTADATGSSERSVQREVERGEKIGPEALHRLAGTTLDKGEELDALAKLPEEKRNALIDRAAAGDKKVSAKVEAKKDRRETRERELGARQAALPEKRYGVIYADPEWRFEPWSRETGLDRAADNHYPTSALEVIQARPVETIAAKDCVLFLWATAPMMPHALLVMAAWGFNYVSQAIWAKDRIGTGYWFRNKHELLLVGTRGDIPAPAMGTQWPSIVEAPVGGHSEKPEKFYELIEAYYPTLPKIELNARERRRGWDAWGFEAPDEPIDPETGEILATPEGHSSLEATEQRVVQEPAVDFQPDAAFRAQESGGVSLSDAEYFAARRAVRRTLKVSVRAILRESRLDDDQAAAAILRMEDENLISKPDAEGARTIYFDRFEGVGFEDDGPLLVYPGFIKETHDCSHYDPPTVSLITDGEGWPGRAPALAEVARIQAMHPEITEWVAMIDGEPFEIPPAPANAEEAAVANTEDPHEVAAHDHMEKTLAGAVTSAPAPRNHDDLEIPEFLRRYPAVAPPPAEDAS